MPLLDFVTGDLVGFPGAKMQCKLVEPVTQVNKRAISDASLLLRQVLSDQILNRRLILKPDDLCEYIIGRSPQRPPVLLEIIEAGPRLVEKLFGDLDRFGARAFDAIFFCICGFLSGEIPSNAFTANRTVELAFQQAQHSLD
ncbi:MAG: hypothetical protein WCG79_08270 [Verrucomicrobiota bacterium]